MRVKVVATGRQTARDLGLAFAIAAALNLGSCSLGNVPVDLCDADLQCIGSFGLGSECRDGYCTDPKKCVTGHQCRAAFGGGACVEGSCRDTLPVEPNGYCTLYEPANLAGRRLTGEGAPLIAGGIFRLEDTSDGPTSKGAMLAAREINGVSGLNAGRDLALVMCDVGGPGGSLSGDERKARVVASIDYLAGTLGVPFIVGPTTSSDSGPAIGRLLERRLPTVLISPSATSPQLASEPDRLDATDTFGLFWRTAPNDNLQGSVLASHVAGSYPADDPFLSEVAVMYVDNQYGAGLADVFKTAWEKKAGGKVVLLPYSDSPDFKALAASAAKENPEALMIISVDALDPLAIVSASLDHQTLVGKPVYLTDGSKDASRLLDPTLASGVQTVLFNQLFGTAPATPTGASYDFFAAALKKEFGLDSKGFAFVANAYDAVYVGAMGTVYASRGGTGFDGRDVAEGLSRLVQGESVSVGKNTWAKAKSLLTTGALELDVAGISGELDFDVIVGEAVAPIEVWRPSDSTSVCGGSPPCLASIDVVTPP
ncbi:MAG: hypothetical protein EXR75_04215 [Myxococcales bacterium]|nr:hypothetical protein [Myxococcales bacterium]